MTQGSIGDNLAQVQERIRAACAKANRDVAAVTLVAVSKTHPAQAVFEAIDAGLQHFGENRVEEADTKIPVVLAQAAKPVTWHMIGHIQSRKAKDVPPLFDVVHSVDSVKLANKLSAAAAALGKTIQVLLEVNVSGEESKSGFEAYRWNQDESIQARLWDEVQQIVALPSLQVRGLMTMAPIVANIEEARPVFSNLAMLRAALTEGLKIALPDLSMGMTDDYPVAIEEGATIVRIGRAIFGERRERG